MALFLFVITAHLFYNEDVSSDANDANYMRMMRIIRGVRVHS